MKWRQYEFGLKDADYWVFGFLGAMGLFLFLIDDARFVPLALGIFGFLGVLVMFLILLFRNEIVETITAPITRRSSRGG